MSTSDINLSSVPEDAVVRITFQGKLKSADMNRKQVQLAVDGEWLKLSWDQPHHPNEEYVPKVTILDYGFQPGDVATIRVDEYNGHRWETLLAVDTADGNSVRWMDHRGVVQSYDPTTLTLVMRNGFPVASED